MKLNYKWFRFVHKFEMIRQKHGGDLEIYDFNLDTSIFPIDSVTTDPISGLYGF